MSKDNQKKIDYMVVCVNDFAEKFSLNYREAFNYLFKYEAIKFLNENYEIEHTLSIDDALDDMIMIANKNGGSFI